MALYSDLLGTLKDTFQLGLDGVKLKNVSVGLVVKEKNETTDAPVTASKVNISGDVLEINSDAAGVDADWKYIIQRSAVGMSEEVTLTLPVVHGSANQLLKTDGSGALSWASLNGLPAGTNTGDIVRYNAISGQWETTVEPFYFKGLVLTPQAAASVSTEGAMYYDSALKAVIIGVQV